MVSPVYEVALVGDKGFLGTAIGAALTDAGVAWRGFDLDRPFLSRGRLTTDIAGASTVVWAASRVNPATAESRPTWVDEEKEAFSTMVTAVRSAAPDARVVLLSSGGTVYGPPSTPPYRETMVLHPVNSYGRLKSELERVLADGPIAGTSLRVANAYGPGQRPAPGQGVIAHWLSAARDGRPLQVFGNLDSRRDYVYVGDIARAVVLAHQAASPPPAVNIGSGVAVSLGELLDVVLEVTGVPQTRVERGGARATDTDRTWLSVALARSVLGWRPSIDLRTGVEAAWKATLDSERALRIFEVDGLARGSVADLPQSLE